MDHWILAAADLGLSTCRVAAFDPAAAREILSLPNSVEPINQSQKIGNRWLNWFATSAGDYAVEPAPRTKQYLID